MTGRFFGAVVSEARRQRLLSEEHFSVDGTLLEAWASLKSVRPRDEERDPPTGPGGRNPWKDFRGERRSNATHVSTTDPEASLARKGAGQAAKLSFAGHVLMENRNGLVVDVVLSQATGTAETEAGADDAGAGAHSTADHGRGRQGVRHAGVRDHLPLVRDHASRCYEATALSPGPADEPSRGVRGESAGAEAG